MPSLKRKRRTRKSATGLGADCVDCPLADRPVVLPQLAETESKLVICGEGPGAEEEEDGTPFVGRSGRLLDKLLSAVGLPRASCHITNATLCRPDRKLSAKEHKQALKCCRARLGRELHKQQAFHVAALGGRALQSLCGKAKITPWIGAPLAGVPWAVKTKRTRKEYTKGELADFSVFTVHPMLHPAYVLRAPHYGPVLETHFRRAVAFARGQLQPWTWPEIITEPGQAMLDALFSLADSNRPLGVDVETKGTDPLKAPIMCLGLANENVAVSIPWESYVSRGEQVDGIDDYGNIGEAIKGAAVGLLLGDLPKVYQNGQHDILSIESRVGVTPAAYGFDTLLAHAVVAPRLPHDLGLIAATEFHAPRWKSEFRVESDLKGSDIFVQRSPEILRQYNAKDALVTVLLQRPLLERLQETYEGVALNARYLSLMKVALKMKRRGVKVSRERLLRHGEKFKQNRDAAQLSLTQLAGTDINCNSLRQLHSLFFDRLQVQPKKWTETGQPALDEEVLKGLVTYPDGRVEKASRELLRWRRWNKLLSTYVVGMSKELDQDGTLHATWKVWGTRTGRWSATPGLQTIPKRKDSLRNCFVAREGLRLVRADYKQLELRIIALLSGDEPLLETFRRGDDPHVQNAKDIFKRGTVTDNERAMAKPFVYGADYGATVEELWKRLVIEFPNLSLMDVARSYETWFAKHPAIKVWQQAAIRSARINGFVEAPLSGRRQHYLDGQVDPNEVLNYPVQSTGADIIDPALLELDSLLDWDRGEAILMQVHDEIVVEGPDEDCLVALLKQTMERKVELAGQSVRFPIDVSTGPDWGNCLERT